MNSIEVKIGDNFIYISKYGGVVKDVITEITEVRTIDLPNKVTYLKWAVKSSNGNLYDLNEIHIIESVHSDDYADKMTNLLKNASKRKEDLRRKMSTNFGPLKERLINENFNNS